MDTAIPFISARELAQRLATPRWPVVVDVRRAWRPHARGEKHDRKPETMR